MTLTQRPSGQSPTASRTPISPQLLPIDVTDLQSTPPDETSDDAEPSGQGSGQQPNGQQPSLLQPVPTNRYLVFAAIAILGALADLWTKQAMFAWRGVPSYQSTVYWVVDGYVGVQTAVNIGAVFGIGAGKGTFFAIVSVLAAIGIFVWLFVKRAANQWWLTVALGCVMAGIIGNLYDRLGMWWEPGMDPRWKSGVRDWILLQASDRWRWPNFNIADSLLVCGAAMLIYRSFFPVGAEMLHDRAGNPDE